jgi:ribosomal protein S12 methylthiotransferase accessory factor
MHTKIDVCFGDGKKIDAQVGAYRVKTDQPLRNGGSASAPEPFELFFASIATCAGIYALEFCNVRRIPTRGMALSMQCDFNGGGTTCRKLSIDLRLPLHFPARYKKAIIKVMDLCSVKKHILDPPQFEIGVSEGEETTRRGSRA